jgi:DNA-binding CsgD family transcriptional regulator/tetratricopeptide (TPR) repeat protein
VVGREAELAVFARAVDAAAEGVPSVLLVAGDPGIGKSTLVSEAAKRLEAASGRAPAGYVGRCVHVGGEAIALAPLMDLVRQIQRRAADPDGDRSATGSVQDLASALRPGAAGPRAAGVFGLALELLGDLGADGPVIVGFDDLHWADAATWDLLDFLARNLTDERIVLVGTYRPDEVARDPRLRRRVAELVRVPAVERHALGGLDRAAVAVHASAVLGIPAPPALVDELLRRGEGNPFFTEELTAAHLAGEAVPALLSDILEADVAALEPSGRRVVGAIAAVGRDTDAALLSAVVDLDEPAIESAVHAALDAGLLIVDAETDAYRVRHPLIGEVAYAAMLPSERRRLHRAIADTLRSTPGFALAGDAAGELAFHLDRAGDEAGAFAASLDAADAAEFIAPATCLHHLERALELWDAHAGPDRAPERIERLWQAAELASATGQNRRSVDLARVALDLGPPPRGWATGHERLARYLWTEGLMEESAAAYETAAALAEKEDDDAHAAPAFAGLAQGALMFCRFDEAERWATRALEAASADDGATFSMAMRVLGVHDAVIGRPEHGVARCTAAVEAAIGPHRRALAVAYQVITLLDAGRFEDAVATALDGLTESRRAGFEASFGAYLAGEAVDGLTRLGRWAEADAVLASLAGVELNPVGAIYLDAAAAILSARRGALDRAGELLARLGTQSPDPLHQCFVDVARAEVHLAAHAWDAAARVARQALASEARGARWWGWFTALLTVASVEQTLDAAARRQPVDVPAVATELAQLVADVRADSQSVGPVSAMHLTYAEAALSRLDGGDPDRWAEAAAHAETLGDAWTLASARLHEADAAVHAGAAAKATDLLRAAYEGASRLAAGPLLADIEALARRARISVEAVSAQVLDEADVADLGLTPREAEVLGLVAAGRTNREIGAELYVSEKTASVHVSNILRKVGVTSGVEAAAVAQRLGVG